MNHGAVAFRQKGLVLWLFLLLLVAAGSLGWYGLASGARQAAAARQEQRLAMAREALIAYAVLDATRPGRLPCPDLIGDGISPLLTRDNCESSLGGLPWKTLDIADYRDDRGQTYRYVVFPAYAGDSPAPLNSDTSGGLQVQLDGWQHDEAAALIIAPRGRLDAVNADGDGIFRSGRSDTEDDNDVIAILGRRELLAAVEKRVAGEVRQCLEAQAANSDDARYPWPAPLNAVNDRADGQSRFGRVAATQPDAGPDAQLAALQQALGQDLRDLANTSDPAVQRQALERLGEHLATQRNLADTLYFSANTLKQAADQALSALVKFQGSADSATSNDRISRSEGSTLRSLSLSIDQTLAHLRGILRDSGIDPFSSVLAPLRVSLVAASDPASLLSASERMLLLLAASHSQHPMLAQALTTALAAATQCWQAAGNASSASSDPGLLAIALSARQSLESSLSKLELALSNSRINRSASQVADLAGALSIQSGTWTLRSDPGAAMRADLLGLRRSIAAQTGGPETVRMARNAVLQELDGLLTGLGPTWPAPDIRPLESSLQALQDSMASHEASSNNVGLSSLDAAMPVYLAANQAFSSIDTQEPRPTQQSITPYALTLRDTTVDLAFWAKSTAEHAVRLAPLAKANPVSTSSDPAKATPLATSSYQMASVALASLTGSNGSITLLEAYRNRPTASNLAKANTAIAKTRSLAEGVLTQGGTLDGELSSTLAEAAPLVWASRRCDFLRPHTSSWWHNNQWQGTLLYQFSHPLASAPGQLRVNGRDGHRLVVLAAGTPLPGQRRERQGVADYLEDVNAHPSREGSARSPASDFVSLPAAPGHNDRLAY